MTKIIMKVTETEGGTILLDDKVYCVADRSELMLYVMARDDITKEYSFVKMLDRQAQLTPKFKSVNDLFEAVAKMVEHNPNLARVVFTTKSFYNFLDAFEEFMKVFVTEDSESPNIH